MMKGEKVINEKQLGVVMMNLILTLEKFSVSNALSAYERNQCFACNEGREMVISIWHEPKIRNGIYKNLSQTGGYIVVGRSMMDYKI